MFLRDTLTGIGNLISKVVTSDTIRRGKFYCIANKELDLERLYEFAAANGELWPDRGIFKFIEAYLRDSGSNAHNLILEDWVADIKKMIVPPEAGRPYYLSGEKVFYCLGPGSDEIHIESCFRKVFGPWANGNLAMLVDANLGELAPEQNIGVETEEVILQNVSMFLLGIYDGDSYLIWLRDGNERMKVPLIAYLNEL